MSNDLLTAALDYSGRGWRVIALHRVGPDGHTCSCNKGANCSSKGKHPINNKWQDTPALSSADIYATWDVERPPNLGIATGPESGFFVLDIDPEHDGFETMKALVGLHGPLPETFVAQTGSGGYHYLFAMPDFEMRNTAGKVGPGIDTRASGGQIVASPSRTDKGPYVILTDRPVAAAPKWLLEAARKVEHDGPAITTEDLPKPEDLSEAEWKRLSSYAQRAVDAETARLRRLGEMKTARTEDYKGEPWNHTTFEVACALIEFANSPWCAYSLGQAERDVFTLSPRDRDFDDDVVRKTWDSARNRVGDGARAVPEDRRKPVEEDPLFDGVPTRGVPDPTEGGGDPEATPTTRWSGRFFGGENNTTLLARELADGILEMGPIGVGLDRSFWSYAGGVWRFNPDIVRHRTVDLLGNAYRPGHYAAAKDVVSWLAQPITGDPLHQFMNFRNGMLDWATGEMHPHDPAHGATIQFPLDYDPEATCPTFDTFLADVMHEDYVALAWEMLGYLMYSGNPQQVAFMFYGSGQNGKGTLLRVIEQILGRANIANESLDQLNTSAFSSVNLYGKIANIAGDIDATYQEATANFKKITGEDTIGAERKFGDRFNFESWAVPVFSANKFPGSADVTDGYLRRWIVLHFHKTIPNERRVVGLSNLLATEIEGIAAKAVLALRTLMMRGRFDPHGEATKGKEEFAQAIDHVRAWAASDAVLEAPETPVDVDVLYLAYRGWAERSGRRPVSETEFSNRLESVGFPRQGHYHVGIKPAPTNVSGAFFS